jgi:phosphoglycerate dehydrogenase-like enzyme
MSNDDRRPRVLICDPIAEEGVSQLREHFDVDERFKLEPEELAAVVADYEGIVVRSGTQVTASVIEHGLRLKVIGRAGAGLDNIDVAAAREAGIEVVNSPDANTLAVAEHTMGLMLAAARNLPKADLGMKAGRWEKKSLMGTGLAGKTLGIVGFGRIGYQVGLRARAFDMKVLVNQRRPTPELNLQAGVQAVDLNVLLAEADFVTLHVPLKPETKHMIGAEQMALMKPTAILINTARGDVIDEAALLDALENGVIRGAALDVFVEEPATDSALAQHPRVIATPHIASSTEDAQRAAAITIVEKIIDVLQDVEPFSVLPLRVVQLERVYPHESVDQRRVDRLAKRLENEHFLQNPPVVMPVEGKQFMVLDGATRTAALRQLGYEDMVVQVITDDDDLQLHTWYHAIRELPVNTLLDLLNALPMVSLVQTEPERADDELFEYGGLCYLHTVDERVYLVYAAPGVNRLEALNKLTETYIDAGHVSRTLDNNLITLKHAYSDLTATVIFPEYMVQQVIQATRAGRQFPAGITRFIIPGRILRVNADLRVLRSEMTLREKNIWLHELLLEKENTGQIRYYQESVYLLDE